MKRFERRATAQEILSLPSPNRHYQTAEGRRQGLSPYEKKCIEMLDKEVRKFPGYSVHMTVKNHIPHFEYFRRSYSEQVFMRRIDQRLARVEKLLNRKR